MDGRGVLELRQHGHSRLFGILSRPHCILQTVSSSKSTCKIHHETWRNEVIRKSRMQILKIRKIKARPTTIQTATIPCTGRNQPHSANQPNSAFRRMYTTMLTTTRMTRVRAVSVSHLVDPPDVRVESSSDLIDRVELSSDPPDIRVEFSSDLIDGGGGRGASAPD